MAVVYVGLSGGVDSAVAAYLLKKEGHNVVGAFIKGWEPEFLPCTGAEDRLSAMRVAAHLGIPFVTYDLSKEYKKLVVDVFVKEYREGRTPNPDILCNRTIKFGEFWKRAKKDGADAIATGHYAQTDGERLLVSADPEKDQAYFLWTLTQADLAHTLFPVGKFQKGEVRKIAERAGLPNAARKDSQGLCFLGHVDMHEFLTRYIKAKVGSIVAVGGDVLGEHDGVWFYTIGQHVPVSSGKRLYVVGKDVKRNILTVSTDQNSPEARVRYTLTNMNWISGKSEQKVQVQYRYHGTTVPARIEKSTLIFSEPVLCASGQSVVFYGSDGRECLGGGVLA